MRYTDMVLSNEDGTPASENGKPATAFRGIRHALITDSAQLSAAKKLARYELFVKLAGALDATGFELSIEDVALAKEAADVYPTLVFGQLVSFLEQR